MHHAMTVQVAGATVTPVVFPGGFAIKTGAGDLEQLSGSTCARQKIDQIRVGFGSVWIVAIDTRKVFINNMSTMEKRFITI